MEINKNFTVEKEENNTQEITMSRKERIFQQLNQLFKPKSLQVIDQSHLHAGHSAMKGLNAVETHFRVEIVSDSFEGKSPIQRHRLINEALKDHFDDGLHALSLSAKTLQQAQKSNKKQ